MLFFSQLKVDNRGIRSHPVQFLRSTRLSATLPKITGLPIVKFRRDVLERFAGMRWDDSWVVAKENFPIVIAVEMRYD